MGAILDNLAKANEAIENEVAFSRDQMDRQFGQVKTAAGSGITVTHQQRRDPSATKSGTLLPRPRREHRPPSRRSLKLVGVWWVEAKQLTLPVCE